MTAQIQPKTIAVLGGTGKTGRRVAQRLTARGMPFRICSRSGKPPFDWTDPATWPPVVRDVESVYVTYQPDIAIPGAAAAIDGFAHVAVDNGVRRLVLLLGRGEEEVLPAEQAVRDCGAEWTIIRASWFYQNFSEAFLLKPVLGDEVAVPAGNVTEPFADVEDVADVAMHTRTPPASGPANRARRMRC